MDFNINLPGQEKKIEEFTLPSKEEIKKEAIEIMSPEEVEVMEIEKSANNYVDNIMKFEVNNSQQKLEIGKAIETFGLNLMKQSESKNKMLDFQIKNLYSRSEEGGSVANTLLTLQNEVKGIDPNSVDFTKKGIFSKIFNPIKSYFDKYKKASDIIENLVDELQKGGDMLKRDNITLAQEMESMRILSKDIAKSISMGEMIDQKLTLEIENARNNNQDLEKIKFFEEELMFPLKQRIIDLQTILAVNQQGFVAMDIIRKNNKELIRGVDRAKIVTINALKIAVIVAKALADQEIVLKRIQSLNATTNNLIASTAEKLKTQGVDIQKQASESMINAETLKKAFADCMEAIENISKYRQEALPLMSQTIKEFKELTEEGEKAIVRIESSNQKREALNF